MLASYLFTAADFSYLLCSGLLLGSAVVVRLRDGQSALHRRYALTALSLLGWVATLGLFYPASNPDHVLALGRANFAFAACAVYFGYLLVQTLAEDPVGDHSKLTWLGALLALETLLLATLSAFTPLIDQAEVVHAGVGGRHLTEYGLLFPLYIVHIVGYLGTSALTAARARHKKASGPVRDRLTLVSVGVAATGLVGIITDIVLPYGFGDFRFTDFGPLSTALFLLAVGYAVLKRGLFDVRRLVRKTLVLGFLGSLALAAYGAVLVLATERFAGSGSGTLTRFGVLVIALSFDPLRRDLEAKVDKLLFQRRRSPQAKRQLT